VTSTLVTPLNQTHGVSLAEEEKEEEEEEEKEDFRIDSKFLCVGAHPQ